MTSPVDPFARLGRIVRDLGREVEFQLVSFVLIPDLDGDNHGIRCVYRTDVGHLARTAEQRNDEAELEAMLHATRRAEVEAEALRLRQRAEGLAERLRDPDQGIL